MIRIKVAVLISGRGSNLKALIDYAKNNQCNFDIKLVVSNKEDAKGLQLAKENNIKSLVINHKKYSTRREFEQEIDRNLTDNNCQLICLAGFMRILSEFFIDKWQGKIINIHPSLLPAFKGENAVKDAIDYGVKIAGCTTHLVDLEVDCGKILMQESVVVQENDDYESLAAKILEKEHQILPISLNNLCKGLS